MLLEVAVAELDEVSVFEDVPALDVEVTKGLEKVQEDSDNIDNSSKADKFFFILFIGLI